MINAVTCPVCYCVTANVPTVLSDATCGEILRNFIEEEITAKGYACVGAIHRSAQSASFVLAIVNIPVTASGRWGTIHPSADIRDADGKRIPCIDPRTGLQRVGFNGAPRWKRVYRMHYMGQREALTILMEALEKRVNAALEDEHADLSAAYTLDVSFPRKKGNRQ